MSTAALAESAVESPKTAVESRKAVSSVAVAPVRVQPELAQPEATDPHPLAPVFLIGGMALICALAFVASLLIWLTLRDSGVLAP
jgi:hypothetical protein